MKTPFTARLSLETIEERLTPAHPGSDHGPHGDGAVARPFDSDDSRQSHRPHENRRHPGPDRTDGPRFFLIPVALAPTISSSPPPVQTKQRVAAQPAAQVRENTTPVAAGGVEASAMDLGDETTTSRIGLPSNAAGLAKSPINTLVLVSSSVPPAGTTGSPWLVPFTGVGMEAAVDVSLPEVPDEVRPTTGTKPEADGRPSIGERILDAIFPDGVPLPGVLPLVEGAVERGAVELLTQLDHLWDEVGGDFLDWEQAAWLVGAVLVLGGVTYTVRTNAPRRKLDPMPTGTHIIWEG